MNEKSGAGKKIFLILIVLAIIALAVAVYFTFFFSYKCKDLGCFKTHQAECSKTTYIKESESIDWMYHIKGKSGNNCQIEAKILQIKKGSLSQAKLEGKSMECSLPLGNLENPEADISLCHGILKEEIQNLMIQKLHAYVLDNIGEISDQLGKVV